MFSFQVLDRATEFELLGIKILAVFEQAPGPITCTKDWFNDRFGNIDFAKYNVILISESRSYCLVDFILEIPNFDGFILITNGSYRIGRNLMSEFMLINNNEGEALPTDIRTVPLQFYQPFSLGEICIIPVPNGCGIGASNWIVTKNTDPQLVTFKAYIITGYCENTICFTPAYGNVTSNCPRADLNMDAVCVCPSAISPTDVHEVLKHIAGEIKSDKGKKFLIPAFADDSLYAMMRYFRINAAITDKFCHISYKHRSLMDIMCCMPNETPLDEIQDLLGDEDVKGGLIAQAKVIFSTHPIECIGQVCEIRRFLSGSIYNERNLFIPNSATGYPDLTPNTGVAALERYLGTFQSKVTVLPDTRVSFKGALTNGYYKVDVSQEIVRWVALKKDERDPSRDKEKQATLQVFQGTFVGEHVSIESTKNKYQRNPPDIDEVIAALYGQGASDITRSGNRVECVFDFVEGDNKAAIIYDSDNVTIETGSGTIENVLLTILTPF